MENESDYAVAISDDCTEKKDVYSNPAFETRTYESLKRSPRTENNRQDKKSRNKLVFILAIFISSLVSVGITYTVTLQFSTNGVTVELCSGDLTIEPSSHGVTVESSSRDSFIVESSSRDAIVASSRCGDTVESTLRLRFFSSECPNGWFRKGDACYKFSNDRKTWIQSNDFCRSLGSDLVSFHNLNEENVVSQGSQLVSRYWIGLNDIDKDGKFEWSDGTVFDHANWADFEPNNYNGAELCAVHIDGKWNDVNCYFPHNFICKIKLSSQCGNGSWVFFQNSCYMFDTQGISWNDSRQQCKNNDADLVVIQSREELNFLLSQMPQWNIYWIGLTNRNRQNEYRWIRKSVSWNLIWEINRISPRLSYRDAGCGGVSAHGNLESMRCDNTKGYICEK